MNSLSFIYTQHVWIVLQGPGIDLADGNQGGAGLGSALVIVLAVVGAVAIIVLIALAVRWVKNNVSGGPSPTPERTINRDTRRRIEEAIEQGDFETAGDLYLRAKAFNDAGEAYARGKSYLKAARAFQSSENTAQAIHYFKQAGEFEQAAILYAKGGEHRSAAAEYVQAGKYDDAGKYYEMSGDLKRAAEYYEKGKKYLQAARLYESANEDELAAQSYSAHITNLIEKYDGDYAKLSENERKLARKTAELFQSSEQLDVAAQLFKKSGYFEEAAECMKLTGNYAQAADMLMKNGQTDLAASLLEEGGQAKRASIMRAESASSRGDFQAAAEAYLKAEEYPRAVALYEKLGQWALAGDVYELMSEHASAAQMYVQAGQSAKAALSYEAVGDYARASAMYKEANDLPSRVRMLELLDDNYGAGRLLFELREYDRALRLLGTLDSSEPLYLKSLELQGDIIKAQGRFEKAYSKYRAALGARTADKSTIPLHYKMARALEEINDRNGAIQNYETIISIDPHFEDSALRLKALKERKRRPKTTGSGLFSANNDMGESARRYEIIEEVARGGMGIVYKAKDTVLGRIVAYKVLGENLRENDTAVKYFLREARAAAALSHPNIVTIFDAGEQDGEYYMAMEFVEGTTLKELIKRAGALPNEQIEYIMINCCRALEYAHSKGVIHRDIKSGNVMITRDRTLKVMDFGLAKFLREYQNNHTQQVGTPFYMSPEQIIGRNVDFRSDLYSLGCMIFECATGTVPFFKGDLSYHHIHTTPPKPSSINPQLSARLEAMTLKLLNKKPDDRYQSASEMIKLHASGKI